MVITYSKSMDQPGKVANPARSQLNRAPENLVSRDGSRYSGNKPFWGHVHPLVLGHRSRAIERQSTGCRALYTRP